MKNSNSLLKFSGFCTEDYEFISYIGNVQVDFCCLLKRKDQQYGDLLENFDIVKNIFTVSSLGRVYAKDVATNEKYLNCNIVKDGNKKYLHNKKFAVNQEYIVVPYRELYFRSFLEEVDKGNTDMRTIYTLWNQKLIQAMIDTVNLENSERKARTRQ